MINLESDFRRPTLQTRMVEVKHYHLLVKIEKIHVLLAFSNWRRKCVLQFRKLVEKTWMIYSGIITNKVLASFHC